MATGEHQAVGQSIGTSSTVTVGLLCTLLAVAAGAGAAHWRLGAVERLIEKQEAINDVSREAGASHEVRLQRVEDHYEAIEKRLDSLDRKLDRLSGVRPARDDGR